MKTVVGAGYHLRTESARVENIVCGVQRSQTNVDIPVASQIQVRTGAVRGTGY